MVNKTELIALIAEDRGCSQAEAERSLRSVLRAIVQGVKEADAVKLVNFGVFKKSKRAARQGFSPKRNKPIEIPAHTTVTFKPGQGFKDAVG